MYMNWSHSVDSLLDKIRLNSVYLTNRHINNHLYYKGANLWFEIPTIVLSVFSGSFSVNHYFDFYQTLYENSRKFNPRTRTCCIL